MLQKCLVIQTAFIGDVILSTPILEKLHRFYPTTQLDILVRRGNETVFKDHPFLHRVWIWDKAHKYRDAWRLLQAIRTQHYDAVINLQRFAMMGILTALSGARQRIGFDKSPLAWAFTHRLPHLFGTAEQPIHEVTRNLSLIQHLTDDSLEMPRLYPPPPAPLSRPYICIAPASVWATKRLPPDKWVALIDALPPEYTIYLMGAPEDKLLCETINTQTRARACMVVAGQFNLLQSAALMRDATLNYVNDSAPLHLASAVNAPVAAVFCSTVPAFGFTPLSQRHYLLEYPQPLDCRPCGLHGKAACPKGHFRCGDISLEMLLHPFWDVINGSTTAV